MMFKEIPVYITKNGYRSDHVVVVEEGNLCQGLIKLDPDDDIPWRNKIHLSSEDVVKICLFDLRVQAEVNDGFEKYKVWVETRPTKLEVQIANICRDAYKAGLTIDIGKIAQALREQ